MTDNTDLLQDIPLVAGLNFKHLLYFWQVVKTGSIAKAASTLGLSPPTVSVQVRALEESLGKELLLRKGRGLGPTELGMVAYQAAERIFSSGEKLMRALQEGAADLDEVSIDVEYDDLPTDTAMSLRDKAAETVIQASYDIIPWAARERENYFEDLLAWLRQTEEERPPIQSVCPNALFLQLFAQAVSEDADGRFSRWYQSSAAELKEFGAMCLDLAAELERAVFGTIGGEESAALLPTQNTAEAVVLTPADREASPETRNTWPGIRE